MAEDRGGVHREYVSDPNGNLVAEFDEQSQSVKYEADYWPFGEVQSESGTKQSEWGFGGTLGCMTDLPSMVYMRARTYRPSYGRWQTVDPIWPITDGYGFVHNSPVVWVDPQGLNVMPVFPSPGSPPYPTSCSKYWNEYVYRYCNNCYRNPSANCKWHCSQMAWLYYRLCNKPPTRDPYPFFGPPVGGGAIAPRPRPLPRPKPNLGCYMPKPESPEDCAELSKGNWGAFDMGYCENCCRTWFIHDSGWNEWKLKACYRKCVEGTGHHAPHDPHDPHPIEGPEDYGGGRFGSGSAPGFPTVNK